MATNYARIKKSKNKKKRHQRKNKSTIKNKIPKNTYIQNTQAVKKNTQADFKLCIALDVGTHGVALAYGDKKTKKVSIHNQLSSNQHGSETKARCAIILNESGEVTSFGLAAVNSYLGLPANWTKWMLFDRFKMSFINNQLRATNGKTLPTQQVFIALFKYLKEKKINTWLKKEGYNKLKCDEIEWIISIPVIWNNNAKNKMKKYAIKAGLVNGKLANQCKIVYEPDCASQYVLRNKKKFNILNGDKYLLVDAGGGTVNIGCYQIKNSFKVEQIYSPTGGNWGGRSVDDKYVTLLEQIFSKKWINEYKIAEPVDFVEISHNFEQSKHTFYVGDEKSSHDHNVKLTEEFCGFIEEKLEDDDDEEYDDIEEKVSAVQIDGKPGLITLDDDTLTISASVWKSQLFDPVINQTINKMKQLLNNSSMKNCKYLCLVGGFSCSPYFQYRIKQEFENKLKIIIPKKPMLSVVEGGVYLGLQDDDDLKKEEEMELEQKQIIEAEIEKRNKNNKDAEKHHHITIQTEEQKYKSKLQNIQEWYDEYNNEYEVHVSNRINNDIKATNEYRNYLREINDKYTKQLAIIEYKYDKCIKERDGELRQCVKNKKEQDTNAKNTFEDTKNVAINEYKENMKLIESRYNDCISQIKNVFHETIKQLNDNKLEKEKNDEEAKKNVDKTIEIEAQKYKNKLKIINNWCHEYEIHLFIDIPKEIHGENRINNNIETTKKHKKYLEELKDNYAKELATTRFEYNDYISKIEQMTIENIKYAEQIHKELIIDKNKQDINAENVFETAKTEAMNEYEENTESIEMKYNNGISQIEKLFTKENFEELNKNKLEKERNDEDAKNEYDKTMKIYTQRYENKLKIINDFYDKHNNEYKMHANNRIKNDIKATNEYINYLRQIKDKYAKELSVIESKYDKCINERDGEFSQCTKCKKEQDTNAKHMLEDTKNVAMNEYKENMKSIEIRYNNCISQIKNVFHQTIKQLKDNKLEKEKNDKEAKKSLDKTIEIEQQKYKNKLKIINDWCNEYEIHANNKINNDIQITKKHKKYLEELKDNYSKELATTCTIEACKTELLILLTHIDIVSDTIKVTKKELDELNKRISMELSHKPYQQYESKLVNTLLSQHMKILNQYNSEYLWLESLKRSYN